MEDEIRQYKRDLHAFLCRNVLLHIYSIGDLDDFFWPDTRWLVTREAGAIDALALLYNGPSLPTLLALTDDLDRMASLLNRYAEALPSQCYAHLSPGVEELLSPWYDVEAHGRHLKMGLREKGDFKQLPQDETASMGESFRLSGTDLAEVAEFYERSYPGNWFDPRMLETGQYFGLREQGALVSVAGVHVYSPQYRVAALGNIATLPNCRGQGFARRVTTAVCRSLLSSVDHIGLNVKADNEPAIRCYRRLGFETVATYGEFALRRSCA